MKNKKIIPLTVFAVTLVLVGILGLSKVFETSWQSENTIDNSLNAEIVDGGKSVFNYRFVTPEEVSAGAQTDWFIDNRYVNNYNFPIPDGALPYQTIANIAGDAITYSTGFTNHQKRTAYLSVAKTAIGHTYGIDEETASYQGFKYTYTLNNNAETVYAYKYETYNELVDTPAGKATDTIITVYLDMFTGEIYYIDIYYNKDFLNSNEKFSYDLFFGCSYVEGQTEKELLSSALEIAKLCGCKEQFTRYCVLEFADVYQVIIEYAPGKVKYIEFLKENNSYMFTSYNEGVHHYSPYNFNLKDIDI